jgi:hypothetical protein
MEGSFQALSTRPFAPPPMVFTIGNALPTTAQTGTAPTSIPLTAPNVPLANALPLKSVPQSHESETFPLQGQPPAPITNEDNETKTAISGSNLSGKISEIPPSVTLPVSTLMPEPLAIPALTLRAGTALDLRVVNVFPPETPSAEIANTTTSGNQVVATVIGNGPQGQLLLSAGETTFFVRRGDLLPVGTKFLLTLLPPKIEETAPPLNQELGTGDLRQLMQALASFDPQMAGPSFQTQILRSDQITGGALFFFLSVFSKGKFQDWLDQEMIDRLRLAKKDGLINALMDEFKRNNGIARDGTVGEWRSLSIPFYDQGQYQFLRIYLRDNDQQRKDENHPQRKGADKTRFIINLNPTRLGAMQMDGLAQVKQLDIIIRSERALPQTLPHELRELYIKTLGAFDYAGTITFQTGRRNWVVMQTQSRTEGVVT